MMYSRFGLALILLESIMEIFHHILRALKNNRNLCFEMLGDHIALLNLLQSPRE